MMLKNICGDAAMNQLMLCTTMWDKVDADEGSARLDELYENSAWKEMISKGASTAAISNVKSDAKSEAERIVGELIKNAKSKKLVIKDKLVNKIRGMEETSTAPNLGKLPPLLRARRSLDEPLLKQPQVSETRLGAAKEEEVIRVQELKVGRLKAQAEEQARALQTQIEHFLLERQQAKREMKTLREQMRKTGQAIAEQSNPERSQREDEAADGEMKRLRELMRKQSEEKRTRLRKAQERKKRQSEQARVQKNRVKQTQQELKKAERALKALRKPSQGSIWSWLY